MKNTMVLAVSILLAPTLLFADTVYLECEVEIVAREKMAGLAEDLLGDTSAFTVSLNKANGSVSHVYSTASRFGDFRESGVFSPSSVAYSRSFRIVTHPHIRLHQDFTIDRSDLGVQVNAVVYGSDSFLGAYVQQGKCEIFDIGKTRKF